MEEKEIFISKKLKYIEDKCQVLLLYPGKGIFDYKSEKKIKVGQVVSVPLKNKNYYGIVIGKGIDLPKKIKLKVINNIIEIKPLSIEILNFCYWLSEWCMYDNSVVTRMTIPSFNFMKPVKNKRVLYSVKKSKTNMTKLGLNAFNYISDNPGLTVGEYVRILKISNAVISKLIKDKNIIVKEQGEFENKYIDQKEIKKFSLSKLQLQVVDKVQKFKFKNNPFLLDGVTGSGKTEVYLKIISKELSGGKQSLVLLPEIALTNQLIYKFEERFGFKPFIWHSDLSPRERHNTWQAVLNGTAKIVVGARSALFLPFNNLTCIVVDEEHDQSFKQDEGVNYNARDMAVVRGQIANAIVILSSATPSLESLNNVKLGKYISLSLPKRYGNALMPKIHLIDMKKAKTEKGRWISDVAFTAIENALKSEEQVLLYLNRRGYAPLTICGSCGFRLECSHCSSWLVRHAKENKMKCHYCSHYENITEDCVKCGASESNIPCGPGVERLAEEIHTLFPNIKLQILTSDTIDKNLESNPFKKIINGEVNIIIGTQLVAKGHHFPNLNTVIAIDADLGLSGTDLRATEKTLQIMMQLSGRAGRESKIGAAYIQTYDSSHAVMKAILSGSRDAFVKAELDERSSRNLPPFGRLASLIIQSKDLKYLESYLKIMSRHIPNRNNSRIIVLGPAPAPIPKLRDWHRFRYLIKSKIDMRLQFFIKEWMLKIKTNKAIRIKIDIDPYNFM